MFEFRPELVDDDDDEADDTQYANEESEDEEEEVTVKLSTLFLIYSNIQPPHQRNCSLPLLMVIYFTFA